MVNADPCTTHGLFVCVRRLCQHALRDAFVQLAGDMRVAIVGIGKVSIAFDAVEHAETGLLGVQLGRRF